MNSVEEFGSKLAAAAIALVFLYHLVRFVINRRCPRCGRLFGGKKGGSSVSNSSKRSGRFWDYASSSFKRETRRSATVSTLFTCKKCGHHWSSTSRQSSR
jgi:hypothetical protein